MRELYKFELTRLKNKKLLFLMPMIFIIIGIAGIILSNVFYSEDDGKLLMANMLNAYNQFTFIFFSFIYIYIYSSDIKSGINVYVTQIGYSLKQIFICKTLIMYLLSVFFSNVMLIIMFLFLGNYDVSYLLLLLMTFDINLIFIILFSLLLSLLFKNTMTATLVCFAMFIVFNTANLMFFGIFNQADPNSLSYNSILVSINQGVEHRTISKLNINLAEYKYLFIWFPNLIWISILLIVDSILIKKRGNKIEL